MVSTGRRLATRLGTFFIVAVVVGLLAGCDPTPVMVTGTVTANPSGTGVGGVAVQVYAFESETLVAETVTGIDGGWQVHESALPEGVYRFRIGGTWWPGAPSWDEAAPFQVSSASPVEVDWSVAEIGTISGGVVDDDGNALSGIVVVAARSSDAQPIATVETDGSGQFTLPVIEAGTFRLGLADPTSTWQPVLFGGATPTDVEVTTDANVGQIVMSTGLPYNPPQAATTRVSVAADGAEGDGSTYESAISADGRYVAFQSLAYGLVPGDGNWMQDVFVKDRTTGAITLVSVDASGDEGDSDSASPAISADGRYVAFESYATSLVTDDDNGAADVFVHDRTTGDTTRVSIATDGTQAAGGDSFNPAISADGRYVAFQSAATNLVADDTNTTTDVFVHDRTTGVTTRVSVATDGTQAVTDGGFFREGSTSSAISADGNYVSFQSDTENLVADDENGASDVFVHDRTTGDTTRVSVDSTGAEGDYTSIASAISATGRYVTFFSYASNLVVGDTNGVADVFVHDRTTGDTTRVSIATDGTEGDNNSEISAISADGRYVTFSSMASTLVEGDSPTYGDVFVRDRTNNTTTRVNVAPDGAEATGGYSWEPTISTDGRYIAYTSDASNLVANDNNGISDVFVFDQEHG